MIPFTQYLLPRGQRRAEQIERPADIEALAEKFIASGGRYECELLRDGSTASLTAVHKVDDEEQDIAIVLSVNGPAIPEKVDELVRRSADWLREEAGKE